MTAEAYPKVSEAVLDIARESFLTHADCGLKRRLDLAFEAAVLAERKRIAEVAMPLIAWLDFAEHLPDDEWIRKRIASFACGSTRIGVYRALARALSEHCAQDAPTPTKEGAR